MIQKTTIVTWNPQKGFGFVVVEGKRAFLHVSVITPPPERGSDLRGSEVVVTSVTEEKKGLRVERAVSAAEWQRQMDEVAELHRRIRLEKEKNITAWAQISDHAAFWVEVAKVTSAELVNLGQFEQSVNPKVMGVDVVCWASPPDKVGVDVSTGSLIVRVGIHAHPKVEGVGSTDLVCQLEGELAEKYLSRYLIKGEVLEGGQNVRLKWNNDSARWEHVAPIEYSKPEIVRGNDGLPREIRQAARAVLGEKRLTWSRVSTLLWDRGGLKRPALGGFDVSAVIAGAESLLAPGRELARKRLEELTCGAKFSASFKPQVEVWKEKVIDVGAGDLDEWLDSDAPVKEVRGKYLAREDQFLLSVSQCPLMTGTQNQEVEWTFHFDVGQCTPQNVLDRLTRLVLSQAREFGFDPDDKAVVEFATEFAKRIAARIPF